MNPDNPSDNPVDGLLDRLVEEFARRRAHGERPDIDEYGRRYPLLAAPLRRRLLALGDPVAAATLPAPAVASSVHPTADDLVAFAQGRLQGDALAAIERHVGACASCCQVLGQVSADSLLR